MNRDLLFQPPSLSQALVLFLPLQSQSLVISFCNVLPFWRAPCARRSRPNACTPLGCRSTAHRGPDSPTAGRTEPRTPPPGPPPASPQRGPREEGCALGAGGRLRRDRAPPGHGLLLGFFLSMVKAFSADLSESHPGQQTAKAAPRQSSLSGSCPAAARGAGTPQTGRQAAAGRRERFERSTQAPVPGVNGLFLWGSHRAHKALPSALRNGGRGGEHKKRGKPA